MNNKSIVLEVVDVTKRYSVPKSVFKDPDIIHALNGVSFNVHAGETLAVVGESGCGKSTLARMITMIEEPSHGSITIDSINLDCADDDAKASLRSKVQIVFQDPYGSLNPRQKIGSILEEPLLVNRPEIKKAERSERAYAMLKAVGLRPEYYGRYPHMFSGGQRQRIAIARALMLEPKILVLDEPVSALDVSIQSQILNLLNELQQRLGLAYIFISHDLSVVRFMAQKVLVMYLGSPIEMASRDDLFASPKHPYTKALLSATPVANPNQKFERIKLKGELPSPLAVPSGCSFNPRCWLAKEKCRLARPMLDAITDDQEQRVACFYPIS